MKDRDVNGTWEWVAGDWHGSRRSFGCSRVVGTASEQDSIDQTARKFRSSKVKTAS